MKLSRRVFLKSSSAFGAATLLPALPACGPGPADGSFENPYTREDPGEWGEKIEVHQPRVFGALVDQQQIRLWIEVEDDVGATHEQTPEHFVSQIVVQDQNGGTVANVGFQPGSDARVVTNLIIGPEVEQLFVYEACNLHGVWLATYDMAALRVPPEGDERRALTPAQPGEWGEKIAVHMPLVFDRGDGFFLVEIGDRANDALHVMDAEHYVDEVVVLDQNSQVLARQAFSPADPEPAFNAPVPAGTTTLRVIASCNLHQYWEAVFTVG
jgi:desulfoferrodoxin (superoxide reductase-like protein)